MCVRFQRDGNARPQIECSPVRAGSSSSRVLPNPSVRGRTHAALSPGFSTSPAVFGSLLQPPGGGGSARAPLARTWVPRGSSAVNRLPRLHHPTIDTTHIMAPKGSDPQPRRVCERERQRKREESGSEIMYTHTKERFRDQRSPRLSPPPRMDHSAFFKHNLHLFLQAVPLLVPTHRRKSPPRTRVGLGRTGFRPNGANVHKSPPMRFRASHTGQGWRGQIE